MSRIEGAEKSQFAFSKDILMDMNIKSLRSLYIRAQLQLREAEDYENNVPIHTEIYNRMVARY